MNLTNKTLITATILLLGVLLSVCSAQDAQNVYFPPNEIMFGTECGLFHIMGNYSSNLIWYDHPVFYQNKYFYYNLAECGFVLNDPGSIDDDLPGINYDRQAYKRCLLDVNGQAGDDNYLEILNDPMGYNDSQHSIKILSYPNGTIPGLDSYNTYFAWKCQYLHESHPLSIWYEDFFEGKMANSITVWGPGVYRADNNPGGFVIGQNTQNNDPESNWVFIPGNQRALTYGNNYPLGKYTISLRVKKLNNIEPNHDAPILRLYYKRNSQLIDSSDVLNSDIPSLGTPTWVHFHVDSVCDTYAKRQFALKWCGVEYEGFLRGILEVDSIAYECSFHDELFDDPDDESPSGEHWDDFLALFQADVTINPNNFMGFMCPEPYPYAWSSFKKITDALRTTLPNSNNFCLTAQYPSNPGEVMDDYLNETGVDAMWFDSYPINFGTDGGAWWHTESSEDDNGTTPKSKSIQNACRLFFYGQETHPDWSSYHHGATYAAIHSVLFTCA